MRSNFVATISRYKQGSIDTEQYESSKDALEGILAQWGDQHEDAEDAADAITENVDPDMVNEITKLLLETSEPDDLAKILDCADDDGYAMRGQMLKELLGSIKDEVLVKAMSEFGWVRKSMLERYGHHDLGHCAASKHSDWACDCGFDAALRAEED